MVNEIQNRQPMKQNDVTSETFLLNIYVLTYHMTNLVTIDIWPI